MRVTWYCPKCKIRARTLRLSEPAMHWCKADAGKYTEMKEVEPEQQ